MLTIVMSHQEWLYHTQASNMVDTSPMERSWWGAALHFRG